MVQGCAYRHCIHIRINRVTTTPQHLRIHGGVVLKVAADGSKLEVVATGFRNPNGLGVGPNGVITAADQQGTWMPSSRVDIVVPGGFYGYMPMHHRKKAPTTYDGPVTWIPHKVDNSCGGQAWVEGKRWGPIEGELLHLSYGRCEMFHILFELSWLVLWDLCAKYATFLPVVTTLGLMCEIFHIAYTQAI